MPLSTITATLDNTIRCTFNEFCTQQQSNVTQEASISFTTLLTAGSTLLATIYAAASSSLTLSSIKLLSFYNKQRLTNNFQFIQSTPQLNAEFNSSTYDLASNRCASQSNTSPTQSEIVSITGALIVFTVLLATVLLTHLFDTINNFTRKCCKIKVSNLVQIGLGKNLRQLASILNQLILDLLITIVLKSALLTSLFIDERTLRLTDKLNDFDYNCVNDDESRQLIEILNEELNDLNEHQANEQFFTKQRKWSTWFAGQLRKRLIH